MPFDVDDTAAGPAAEAEWLEIIRTVSLSRPEQSPELWLGQLVVEAQMASDRAVAVAHDRAGTLVAEARAEAIALREAARRRVQELGRLRAALYHDIGRSPSPPPGDPGLVPIPPRAIFIPRPAARPTPVEDSSGPPVREQVPLKPPLADATAPHPTPLPPTARVVPEEQVPVVGPAPSPWLIPEDPPPRKGLGKEPPPRQQPQCPPATASGGTEAGKGAAPASRRRVRATPAVLVAAVVAAVLGLVAFERYGTAAGERGSQRQLQTEFATELGRPLATQPSAGAAFGLLSVPRASIKGQAVVEGTSLGQLRRGPAHDSTSKLPGQRGAVVIVAHSRTYGGPFRRIGELRVGDLISIRTPAGVYDYRVSGKPQVVRPGAGAAVKLPSAAEVRAAAGAAGQADQSLVLATGSDLSGKSLEVVVATRSSAGVPGHGTPGSGGGAAVVHAVPGDRVGLLMIFWWVVILAGAVDVAKRVRRKLPAAVVVGALSLVALVAVYQMVVAFDRLLPGTY